MKRKGALLIIICFTLALSACGEAVPSEEGPAPAAETAQIGTPAPAPEPSVEPEPAPEPTPAWKSGIAAGYGIGVVYCSVDRGTELEIIGEDDWYYTVLYDGTELLVKKCFVRDAEQPAPEEYKAYAKNGAEIYAGPYLTGEPLEKLRQNSTLTVIDEFGGLMYVRTDKSAGYIRSALVSPVWISWTDGGYGAGDDSGNSGNSGSGNSGGEDGGDIKLGSRKKETAVPVMLSARFEDTTGKTADLPSRGIILADGVELYLGIVYPGDELMVLSADEKTAEIYTARGTGILPRWAVLLSEEEPYETWTGYALYDAKMYGNYRLTGEYETLSLNTEMTVILETEDSFFIKLSDGRFGYVLRDAISRTKTVIYYEGPGDSGGSSNSGAGEWTEQVL